MQTIVRSAALGLNFVVLASVPWIRGVVGGDLRAYAVATVLLAALDVLVVVGWDRLRAGGPSGTRPRRGLPAVVLAVVAVTLLVATSLRWLEQVLQSTNDPWRADQLVVVQRGIERLLAGENPYGVYRLPWEATLAYGPVLWGPFVLPFLLHADLRFASLAGTLFLPVACTVAAAVLAVRARWPDAVGWLGVAVAVSASPSLVHFVSFAHTPVYWPLLGLFAWLVAAGRWRAAAVAMGLLVVARTTMVAIVRVFWMAARHRDRAGVAAVVALTLAAAAVPFLPFLVWDPAALWHSFFGGYQTSIKDHLWRAGLVERSIGVTGWLLAAGWPRAVEPVQALLVLATWGASWRAVGRGASPLPWMALALLTFSMTALWPVYYLYLDVFVLLVCAALAETPWLAERRRPLGAWLLVACTALGLTVGTAWIAIPRRASIDVGSRSASPYLRGFAPNERGRGRTFARIAPGGATVLLPRRSLRDAEVRIDWSTVDRAAVPYAVRLTLNGVPIGAVDLPDRWTQTRIPAPGRRWRIGVNELRLIPVPLATHAAADVWRTAPSIAVDRVAIGRPTAPDRQ